MQTAADSRQAARAAPPPDPAAAAQYLRFALGDEQFALSIDCVREILELGDLTPVPMMPALLRGVMNLRGAVVPVIDLALRFDFPATVTTRRSCIVVVELANAEGGPRVLGLLVDSVSEVLDIDAGCIEPAPAIGTRVAPTFLRGMARLPGRLVMMLELARVLDADELDRMVVQHAAH